MNNLQNLKLTAEELARLKQQQEILSKMPKATGKRNCNCPAYKWGKERIEQGI